jgi:GAF domain-containing protein
MKDRVPRPITSSTNVHALAPPMVALSTELRCLLIAEAERARLAVGADCASVSCWEPDTDALRVLVNVGILAPGDERIPADETYPLDSFPAVARLIRERRAYLDPGDVASAALAAGQAYVSHAAVPITVGDGCWGELWVGRRTGDRAFTGGDVDQLHLAAGRLGDALAPYV